MASRRSRGISRVSRSPASAPWLPPEGRRSLPVFGPAEPRCSFEDGGVPEERLRSAHARADTLLHLLRFEDERPRMRDEPPCFLQQDIGQARFGKEDVAPGSVGARLVGLERARRQHDQRLVPGALVGPQPAHQLDTVERTLQAHAGDDQIRGRRRCPMPNSATGSIASSPLAITRRRKG